MNLLPAVRRGQRVQSNQGKEHVTTRVQKRKEHATIWVQKGKEYQGTKRLNIIIRYRRLEPNTNITKT